jgi:hypothetical protein
MQRLEAVLDVRTENWDFIQTFNPPDSLSIESGKIYTKVQIYDGAAEFEFVSNLFIKTLDGRALLNNLSGSINTLNGFSI